MFETPRPKITVLATGPKATHPDYTIVEVKSFDSEGDVLAIYAVTLYHDGSRSSISATMGTEPGAADHELRNLLINAAITLLTE